MKTRFNSWYVSSKRHPIPQKSRVQPMFWISFISTSYSCLYGDHESERPASRQELADCELHCFRLWHKATRGLSLKLSTVRSVPRKYRTCHSSALYSHSATGIVPFRNSRPWWMMAVAAAGALNHSHWLTPQSMVEQMRMSLSLLLPPASVKLPYKVD
jgi:hypothetical protein